MKWGGLQLVLFLASTRVSLNNASCINGRSIHTSFKSSLSFTLTSLGSRFVSKFFFFAHQMVVHWKKSWRRVSIPRPSPRTNSKKDDELVRSTTAADKFLTNLVFFFQYVTLRPNEYLFKIGEPDEVKRSSLFEIQLFTDPRDGYLNTGHNGD